MLSFEEKKAIFHSFKLKEKKNGNGKVSFVYPESVQKGQVLATQLHPSGNGYVIGKYMTEETIKKNGYQVDSRGWISIKVFSKEEMAKVITEAMNSMSAGSVKTLPHEVESKEGRVPEVVETVEEAVPKADEVRSEATERTEAECLDDISEKIVGKPASGNKVEETAKQGTYEFYPSSCLFAWMGLTLSTMEYGYLVWRRVFRKSVGYEPPVGK